MEFNNIAVSSIDIQKSKIEIIDHSKYGVDFNGYLEGLIQLITTGGSGRTFRFDRETTEVRSQITRLLAGDDFADISSVIANRLLMQEHSVQEKIAQLKVDIQKGIVVQALIQDEEVRKFVICKSEHSDFLSEIDFKKQRGLPIKKKVYKAVIFYLNDTSVQNVLVYDSNYNLAQYWWKDFLELTKVYSDEDNTENAFDAIDKGVLNKYKKDYPQDYTSLRNSTVRYFRAKEAFDMQDYLDNAIGEYTPFHDKFKLADFKAKIKELPTTSKKPFDEQFTIVKDKIKARFINKIQLTSQIDLVLKEYVPDLKNVVTAHKDADGTKYVRINSDAGYRYFSHGENAN